MSRVLHQCISYKVPHLLVSNCTGLLKTFLPLILNFVPNYPGDLDPPRQHFAYETSMQEFTAITDSCMGCADFVHDVCCL